MIKGYIQHRSELVELQPYTDVGGSDFYLTSYRDPILFLKKDFEIYSDPLGENKLLSNDDYIFTTLDVIYSEADFENETVVSTIRMINQDYWFGTIYITYRWVADYLSADMMNRFDRALDQMTNSILTDLSGGSLIDNSGNLVVQGTSWPGFRTNLNDYNILVKDPPDLPLD